MKPGRKIRINLGDGFFVYLWIVRDMQIYGAGHVVRRALKGSSDNIVSGKTQRRYRHALRHFNEFQTLWWTYPEPENEEFDVWKEVGVCAS